MKSKLTINAFEVWVNLGCDLEEQKYAQPVHFELALDFATNLKACLSDKLEDAVDYVAITSIITAVAIEKPYHLIEHLNHSVFIKVSEYLKSKTLSGRLCISVKKIRVPVEHLVGGVTFSCEETL